MSSDISGSGSSLSLYRVTSLRNGTDFFLWAESEEEAILFHSDSQHKWSVEDNRWVKINSQIFECSIDDPAPESQHFTVCKIISPKKGVAFRSYNQYPK